MTCKSKSASLISSRVDWKDSISSWGRLDTKPMVSVKMNGFVLGNSMRLLLVSKVAKSWSLTLAWVSLVVFEDDSSVFIRVLLPAFVYPTIATVLICDF